MIDYTYWQERVRQNLTDGEISYRAVCLGDTAHFFLGVEKMNGEREEKWRTLLAEFGAKEDRSAKWLFYEQGEIILSGRVNGLSEDELMIIGLSSGAEEIYFDCYNLAHFFCRADRLAQMADILSLEDVEIVHTLKSYKPQGLLEIYDKAKAKTVYGFCEKIAKTEFIVDICADFGIGEYWIEEFKRYEAK